MITIKCGRNPYNTINVSTKAVFKIDDDASLAEIFLAVVEVTQFEGYSVDSWLNIIDKMKDKVNKEYSILDFLTDSICE